MNSYFFSSFKDAPENLKFFYKSGLKSLDLPHGFESYESLSCSEKTKKKLCHSHEKKLHRTCIVLRNINKSRFLLNLGACCFKIESCRILFVNCDSLCSIHVYGNFLHDDKKSDARKVESNHWDVSPSWIWNPSPKPLEFIRAKVPGVRIELTTFGLWDQRSTNWANPAFQRFFEKRELRASKTSFLRLHVPPKRFQTFEVLFRVLKSNDDPVKTFFFCRFKSANASLNLGTSAIFEMYFFMFCFFTRRSDNTFLKNCHVSPCKPLQWWPGSQSEKTFWRKYKKIVSLGAMVWVRGLFFCIFFSAFLLFLCKKKKQKKT